MKLRVHQVNFGVPELFLWGFESMKNNGNKIYGVMMLSCMFMLLFFNTIIVHADEVNVDSIVCPECGCELARKLESEYHNFYEMTGYSHKISHAEWYASKYHQMVLQGTEILGYTPFDGNPINLPCKAGGFVLDGNDAVESISWIPAGSGIRCKVDILSGQYERFDGQKYSFNPLLFDGTYGGNSQLAHYESNTRNVQSVFFVDPRVVDYICVTNSLPPERSIEAMQMSVNFLNLSNYVSQDGIKLKDSDMNQYMLYMDQYWLWYEIALERLYGLL